MNENVFELGTVICNKCKEEFDFPVCSEAYHVACPHCNVVLEVMDDGSENEEEMTDSSEMSVEDIAQEVELLIDEIDPELESDLLDSIYEILDNYLSEVDPNSEMTVGDALIAAGKDVAEIVYEELVSAVNNYYGDMENSEDEEEYDDNEIDDESEFEMEKMKSKNRNIKGKSKRKKCKRSKESFEDYE